MANKYPGVSSIGNSHWQYRVKLVLKDGKKVDTTIKYDSNGLPFQTARAAYEAKMLHVARLKSNAAEEASIKKTFTLSDVYQNYLETLSSKKAAATLRKQQSMWDNHIASAFGNRDINSITIAELNGFILNLYNEYTYSYTEGFLKFFYLLFGHANNMEVIDPDRYNRMFATRGSKLSMPQRTQEEDEDSQKVVRYSDEEIKVFEYIFKGYEIDESKIRKDPDPKRRINDLLIQYMKVEEQQKDNPPETGNLLTAFYLGLYCGLRISECFAVRWRNVDWEKKTITINRQMLYYDNQLSLCPVKTLKGNRTVIMPAFLHDHLANLRQDQSYLQDIYGYNYRNTERVYDEVSKEWIEQGDFINRTPYGELLTTNSMKYWAKKIKRITGINFKYHNLRHTFASKCAEANVSMFMLMDLMGHKKIDTTKKYYISSDDESWMTRTRNIIDNMYSYHNVQPDLTMSLLVPMTVVKDSKGRQITAILDSDERPTHGFDQDMADAYEEVKQHRKRKSKCNLQPSPSPSNIPAPPTTPSYANDEDDDWDEEEEESEDDFEEEALRDSYL